MGMGNKVLVGMSGGVDSAVAAALLKARGFEVTGVTLKLWDAETESGCCSLADTEDARHVAQRLDIPFYVLNFKDLFREKVVDAFVKAYLAGETPNPCLACNDAIKFRGMLEKARAIGMDFIATGHYARTALDPETGRRLLLKAADPKKDQSYVLYGLTQDQLSMTLFPLGDMEKPQVRALAAKLGFSVSQKPDSQDICFVGDGHYAAFIETYTHVRAEAGNFIDREGRVLGKHRGLIHYTVGQRKHLGASFGKRMVVLAKSVRDNTVMVGDEAEAYVSTAIAKQPNWIRWDTPPALFRAGVRTRYHGQEADATVEPLGDGTVRITFDASQRAITPGQAAVFYQGDVVLGGATLV